MDSNFITTSFTIKGYVIEEYLGIVTGITIRTKSPLGMLESSFRRLIGGQVLNYLKMCERSRFRALENMVLNAEDIQASAIIGVQFASSEIAPGISEVVCYGTAVKITRDN